MEAVDTFMCPWLVRGRKPEMSLKVVLWCAIYKHTVSIPYDFFLQASLSPTNNTASGNREQSATAPSSGEYMSYQLSGTELPHMQYIHHLYCGT